ncbi:MAG TPA: hypothetical protein VHE79_14050 [Spirochaetia bacterium]
MRRFLAIGICLLVCVAAAQAQDAQKVLDSFRRNFAIASLDVKIQILQDASKGQNASTMGPLYQQAVDFVNDNASLVPTDARFNQLAAIGAEQIGVVNYVAARYSVWKLFQTITDSGSLAKAATALGIVGAGDPEIVADLNRYIDSQNSLFASGQTPDSVVIAAALKSLGRLADPTSFPVLFAASEVGYADAITQIARASLFSVHGDFKELLRGVMHDRPLPEKKIALQMALDSDKLSDAQKSDLALYALDIGLHSGNSDAASKVVQRDLRYVAADSLGARKAAQATSFLIEHLDQAIGEFDKGIVDRNHLLNAIADLGAMGTHDAAVRLTQYLVLINSYTEKGKVYDDQVVYSILQNLGALGDKVAFDDLMYTQYLGYSAGVKKAARAALDKLKW